MKKFLLLVFLCVQIISSINAMEQPKDLEYVLSACRNEIARYLDGKSFAALTRVNTMFCDICDSIPTKYLSIDFASVAEHKNKNLINRFLAEVVEPGIGKEVFCKQDNNDTIKIFERSLNPGVQDFLGDCSLCCVYQGDNVVRCFWFWKSPEWYENRPEAMHCTCYNIAQCDETVNKITKEYLKVTYNSMDDIYFPYYVGLSKVRRDVSTLKGSDNGSDTFRSFDCVNPLERIIKQVSMFMVLVLAAQKNSTVVCCSILNCAIVPDPWLKYIDDRICIIFHFISVNISGYLLVIAL